MGEAMALLGSGIILGTSAGACSVTAAGVAAAIALFTATARRHP